MKNYIRILSLCMGLLLPLQVYAQRLAKEEAIKALKEQAFAKISARVAAQEEGPAVEEGPAIDILPTMESVSKARNQVWSGVFQLVWNDLIDEVNHQPVVFKQKQPVTADLLNKRAFSVKDLSENAYYKQWGLVSPALKKEIEEKIWEKFHEKSRILDTFDWTPAPDKYLLYAMLKKDLEYIEKFSDLGLGSFQGSTEEVRYFGITKGMAPSVRQSVRVLFYNNNNDFAITLQSKQGDLIHLYKTAEKKPLSLLYTEMKQKAAKGDGGYLRGDDQFKAPKLNFSHQQSYPELEGKLMIPSNFVINKALQSIEFKMDEVGAKLVAEAAIGVTRGISFGRNFYFTGAYAIFLEEAGRKPYFAAYISDAAFLQQPEK